MAPTNKATSFTREILLTLSNYDVINITYCKYFLPIPCFLNITVIASIQKIGNTELLNVSLCVRGSTMSILIGFIAFRSKHVKYGHLTFFCCLLVLKNPWWTDTVVRKWTENKVKERPNLKKCQCWGKTAPEDYLSNCTERAWYPTPEMSEISTDNLCHSKEDSKGCSVIYQNNMSCFYFST